MAGSAQAVRHIDAATGKDEWTAAIRPRDAAVGEDLVVIGQSWRDPSVAFIEPRTGDVRARVPATASGMLVAGTAYVTSERGLLAVRRTTSDGGIRVLRTEAAGHERRRIAWERAWPEGCSGPLVGAGDRVVATCENGIEAMDATDGATAWTTNWSPGQQSVAHLSTSDVVVVALGGEVFGLSAATGHRTWERTLVPKPLAAGAGVVVFGMAASDPPRGRAFALDATTGAEIWNAPLGRHHPASAAIRGDVAAFATSEGEVHVLDVRTGSVRWTATAELRERERILETLAPERDSGSVVLRLFASGPRIVGVHGPGGGSAWSMQSGSPLATAGSVLYPAIDEQRIKVFAIDAVTAEPVWLSPPVPGRNLAPVVHGDILYYASEDYYGSEGGHVRAVDRRTRDILWSVRLPARVAALTLAGDHLVAACRDGHLVGIRTGVD